MVGMGNSPEGGIVNEGRHKQCGVQVCGLREVAGWSNGVAVRRWGGWAGSGNSCREGGDQWEGNEQVKAVPAPPV